MASSRRRYIGWIIGGILAVAIIALVLWPRSTPVESVAVERRSLVVSIDADGVVRAHHRFTIAMPATGVLERIDLDPGTPVEEGQILAYMIPPEINTQQRQEATARIESMRSAADELSEQLEAARILVDQTQRRADRLNRLDKAGAVAREQMENARDAYQQAVRQYASIRARQRAHEFEVQALRSVLRSGPGQRIALRAPARGVVLRRFEQSERTVMAGTPILDIGDTTQMDVEIDVLSTDAVNVSPGMAVQLTGWGGRNVVYARVNRVEPAARTKVSALGIEEQRVNVIATISNRPTTLGDGYRVEASIITSEQPRALCIPLGALIRQGAEWFVFVNDAGIARLRRVRLGARNNLNTAVTEGLAEGERVIIHPPETLEDGDRVK